MISNVKVFENIHMKREAVAKDYQVLPLHTDSEAAYDSFKDIFLSITNKHAPLKTKMIRGNQAPFMTKELSKQIMIRSRLRNKFNKHKTRQHWETMHVSETYARVYAGKLLNSIFQNSVIMVLSRKQNFGPPLSLS